jgi:tetratricopeptide (TPR) repeat protein
LWFCAAALPALDFSVRPRGFVLVPLGGKSSGRFNAGGGADLLFDLDLSGLFPPPGKTGRLPGLGYTVGAEGSLGMMNSPAGDEARFSFLAGGFGTGLFYHPLSRLMLRGEGAFGGYRSSTPELSSSSWWWRGGMETGFRVTPGFTLSLNGGWRYYHDKDHGGAALSGLYAGITAQINFETGGRAEEIGVRVEQDEPVYPVFQSLYQDNPAGTLHVTNREAAELRDVRVSFRADRYTASEILCGTIPLIAKGRTAQLPLYADFSPEIFNFTGEGRIVGEVLIRYRMLGRERTSVRSAALRLRGRNAFRWNDVTGCAAFVSPTAPETLEYSKYLLGLARSNPRTGLNRNLQFGIYLLEGLRAGGVVLSGIPDTPYAEYRNNRGADTIQFPSQTLEYRTGDLDDLGLLYAALLEAAGIRAAYIPLEDEFIVLLSLGIDGEDAQSLFHRRDRFLVVEGEAWLPLSMAGYDGGFTAAWDRAVLRLGRAFAEEAGGGPELVRCEEAWRSYPPAALPGRDGQYLPPREALVVRQAEEAIKAYIDAEIGPRIQELRAQLRSGPSASLHTQLGNLYVQSGMMAEAEAVYRQAAAAGYAPAMVNLGNLSLLDRDFVQAEQWYRRGLAADADNAAAARGLEQIERQKR